MTIAVVLAFGLLAAPARTSGAQTAAPESAQAGPASAAAPRPSEPTASGVPRDFSSLDAWLDYQRSSRQAILPLEARVFFRRGMLAHQSGSHAEARRLVRGAVALDRTYLEARWILLCWEATHDPAQALAQAASVVDLVRRDFTSQWSLASNAAYLLVYAWLLALLATAALIVLQHAGSLRHALYERLQYLGSPAAGRTWSWVLLIVPFLLGFGPALPLVAYLAFLAPGLRPRERAVAVLLVASLAAFPIANRVLDRLSLPMQPDAPIATLLPLETDPGSPGPSAELRWLSRRFPSDPFVRFGTGWNAQHAGDWSAAEAAYRDVLSRWPGDATALDNLAASLARQGRRDDAIRSYEQAIHSDPRDATAYFNLSQAHTQAYDFDAASRALSRASALDFDRVREYKNQPAQAGALDPVPEWISAKRFWLAVRDRDVDAGSGVLPALLSSRFEAADARFPVWVAVAAILGLTLGVLFHRGLPMQRCGNCDRVVCRRCSERRRTQSLCLSCARVAGGAVSPDFARILLGRERQRATRWTRVWRTAVGMAFPGAGLVLHRRVWRALMLTLLTASILLAAAPLPWPFAARPRFAPGAGPNLLAAAAALGVVYLLSWWGFASEARRARRRATSERGVRPRRSRADAPATPDREAA